ncbi:MAG: QueT transporter family protein [Firmicutes bacterium]|nr:QueT transporter family protein [Bacillota bacterium]
MDNRRKQIRYLAQAGVIGALYAVMTYVSSVMGLAYGEIQFRISEALTILPMFTPAAIPGLAIGCFIGNLGSPFGMVDVLCGTVATLLGSIFCRYVRQYRWLAPAGTVLANALIVGLEIAWFLPEGLSWAGFGAAALSVGIGEFVMCYGLGLSLAAFVEKTGLKQLLI